MANPQGRISPRQIVDPAATNGHVPMYDAFGCLTDSGSTPGSGITYPGDATKYLDGTGAFTVPSGGGGSSFPLTIVQEAVRSSQGNTSSFTITFPQTAAASGNTLWMIVATDGSAAVGLPSGWTSDINQTQATYARLVVLHKTSASDTSATFTMSASSITVRFFEVSGSHTFDQSSAGGQANSQYVAFPAITPTAGSVVFACVAIVLGGGQGVSSVPPLGPSWRPIDSGVGNFGVADRQFAGMMLTIPASNVSTKPPNLALNAGLFASGGMAYATFSIL